MHKLKSSQESRKKDILQQTTTASTVSGNQNVTNNEVSSSNSHRKNRKRKGKPSISGSSNWAILCSELKTDPYARKTPVKMPEEATGKDEEPAPKASKQEVWFDNVDEILLDAPEKEEGPTSHPSKSLVKEESFTGKTKCVGIDCEMVGIGKDGEESILARVSLVNIYGHCLYDKFVLPREKVTNYRTEVSGVTPELLAEKGEPFMKVQKEVSDILQGSILVGHALENDLKVLFLSHPHKNIRDTSLYKPFRTLLNGGKPSLKKLAEKLLGVKVQKGAHSSVEDAQAAMRLYTMHRKKWEKELKSFGRLKAKKKAKLKKKEQKHIIVTL